MIQQEDSMNKSLHQPFKKSMVCDFSSSSLPFSFRMTLDALIMVLKAHIELIGLLFARLHIRCQGKLSSLFNDIFIPLRYHHQRLE